jgi:microsomal prostaglandin-E synthase 2
MMWAISGRLQKKYGIQGDLRGQLYAAADEWVEAVGNRRFMGGEAPGLADLAVFGVVRSVTGTETFMDLMHNTHIGAWYERMMAAVGDSSRLPG